MTARPLARAPLPDLYQGMNKLETARAIDLEAMKRAGLIVQWWYEAWTFKLADRCTYTPDFVIQKPDGSLEVEETKGWWREDSRVKVKLFAQLYPFPVRAFSKKGDGSWDVEVFR